MKQILSIIIFLIWTIPSYSQDEVVIDNAINWAGVTFDYQEALLLIDTISGKPITGWVKIDLRKTLRLDYYKNGVLDGYSVTYKLKKGAYRLKEIKKYNKGNIQSQAFFAMKRQFIDSTSYSWGLNSYSIWNPDSSNNNLIYREVKNIDKGVIIEHSYYPETNQKLRSRYSTTNSNLLMKSKVWNLGQDYFPFELNINGDLFSFVRYDGNYQFSEHYENSNSDIFLSVEFLPTGKAKLIQNSNDTIGIQYNVIYPNSHNIPGNTFQLENADEVIAKGKIIPFGLFLEIRHYKEGPFRRYLLSYSKSK